MESSTSENTLVIAYLNVHGQSNLTDTKQVQIEDFLKYVMKVSQAVILFLQPTTLSQTMQQINMVLQV